MAEEFVNREEFNVLKEEVKSIKRDLDESQKLLVAIDKKIDIIDSKIITAAQIEDLKFKPLEKRVENLEDNQTWLRRCIYGGLIAFVIELIVNVVRFIK